jgi:RNA polymerase sigma factor (sigma-70 family)
LICTGTGLFKKISDKSIIEGILNQDSKTLNWLYDNYFQTVQNHILKNSGTHDDASDVFQDSIITLYSQICDNSLNLTSDLKGYFFGIARNIWSSYLRKRKVTLELDADLVANDENDLNDLMYERIISRAFQRLKPDMQTVLNLFSEGYSYEDIAVRMNLKNETYARRKKYLGKEALLDLVRQDPEYQEYLRFMK